MSHRKQPAARHQNRICALLSNATEKPTTARVIGYGRVSTEDQNLDVQIQSLRKAGVTDIFVEKVSAVSAKRPMFNLMMKFLERGDTLIVHALSRLGRDVKQIYGILDELKREGVAWRSITEPHLDNSTAMGRFMVTLTGAKDQLERDQIIERTTRGMQERKRQGMFLGRRKLFDAKQTADIRRDRKAMSAQQVAKKWKCSAGTIEKYAPMRKKT